VSFFRDAAWLDADRAKAWSNGLFAVTMLAVAAMVGFSRGGLDAGGKALGTDFLSFYSASELALGGRPAAAYDPAAHHAAEIATFGRDLGYFAFFYPPMFLLVCTPLAVLPYTGALAVWLAGTFSAFAATMRGWLDRRIGWPAVVAYPAVFLTVGHGQNAFLSAALLGAGALWLERRAALAGVAFGLLAFKPHFGLLLPVALIAGRRWKTLSAATATVIAFGCASWFAFGAPTWLAFLRNGALARETLERGVVLPKMASTFAAVRVLGGAVALAYSLQGIVLLVTAVALVWAIKRRPDVRSEGALLTVAALLATPFLLDYDLVMLALPMAWLLREGMRTGFRPWEKIGLLAGYLLPLAARPFAMFAHVPLAPVVLAGIFGLVLRRVGRPHAATGFNLRTEDHVRIAMGDDPTAELSFGLFRSRSHGRPLEPSQVRPAVRDHLNG
jgi:hypothetical protein